ncbi:hypothetical protein [Rhizobium tubonense]|uniref:Uncharacterized protein n=1 Tax=Rhizobium tubonense TaxID=484088 RepID=A0A2W4CQ43_9HYPH|nr:hypothetical protein [Rhizobium tubonense]PZM07584.1 hypothetical protein CPY51_31130 [Rhizobium tubonense]
MKTRNDLIIATLKLLVSDGGAGQAPEPEDVVEIDNIIDGKLAELNRRQIYFANDPDNFDDEFVDPLAIILANTAAPTFGQPRNPQSQATAESTLRQMKNSNFVPGSSVETDYF